jgi:hypothetical protein
MKQQLADLIEAYAAARASGSRLLLEFAVGQLNEFMATADVVPQENPNENKAD